ncbi:MAG: CocE/NonD family hydrolase [Candidatus Bathyarchaeia archaeon]
MGYSKRDPDFDVVVEKDHMVEVRDGTPLATDVYRPSSGGRVVEDSLPTILQRTPYNKEDPTRIRDLGEWFCRRGYVVVVQDFRGRFKSEGAFYKYANMGEDSYDTVEWIAVQPWFSGRIGTIGTSFMAHFQIALACMKPKHLTTMIVNQGGFSNAYLSSCRHMGAFELRQLTWAFTAAASSREASTDPSIGKALASVNPADYLDPSRGSLKRGHSPLSLVPSYERFYLDMLTESCHTDYWKRVGLCAERYYYQMPDIPVLLLGGWYDSYTRTTSELYQGLSSRKKGPIKLIFGPWVHGWSSLESTHAGDVDFGSKASIEGTGLAETANQLALQWFDRWLKGVDNGVEEMPNVSYFVMGGGGCKMNADGRMSHGGKWRYAQGWPLPQIQYRRFYLTGGGGLSLNPPEVGIPPSTYTFDPRDPVPTIGGNISSAHGVMMPGAYNQVDDPKVLRCTPPYLPLALRRDVLVFETQPLTEEIEVTGPITAKLYVSSSAPDTDFTLKLIDRHPPSDDYPMGYAMNLSDTIFRARFHSSWEEPEPLSPDRVYRLEMVSYPTSNIFQVGHKIRVDISSSNYPRFDVNPNSGEPLGLGRMLVLAHQKIYHDAGHTSHIKLPIISSNNISIACVRVITLMNF